MANRKPHGTASLRHIKNNLREEFDIWCGEGYNRGQPDNGTVFFDDVIEFLVQRKLILKGKRWLKWIDDLPNEYLQDGRWKMPYREPLAEGYIPPDARFGG